MIQELKSFFQRFHLSNRPLVVGVSGGKDSMALLHGLHELKINVVATHVNYHLREEESNKDQALVEFYCQQNHIPLEIHNVENTPDGNVQDWARKIRLDFFESTLKKYDSDWIVLAHHADDLKESQWLKFIRFSINGLMGMRPAQGNILRPLLFTPRTRIEQYVNENQIPFRDDQSNFDTKYNRNWLRNEIIPQIEKRFPTSTQAHIDFQKRTENQWHWMEWFAEQWLKENITTRNETNFELRSEKIPNQLPAQWILYKWLQPHGFESKEIEAIAQLPYCESGSKIENTSGAVVFHHGQWILSLKNPWPLSPMVIEQLPWTVCLQQVWSFEIQSQVNPGLYGLPHAHQLDMAQLTPPLTLRPWKLGDEFQPLGMKGKMKVADFLNKKGIPAVQKNQYWILESRQGIALILGLQIAHWCRVENDTKEVLFIHHQTPPTNE